jgi:hypothetical protein
VCVFVCRYGCMPTPDIRVDVIYIYIRYRATFPSELAVYGTRTRDDLNQSLFYLSRTVSRAVVEEEEEEKNDQDGPSTKYKRFFVETLTNSFI